MYATTIFEQIYSSIDKCTLLLFFFFLNLGKTLTLHNFVHCSIWIVILLLIVVIIVSWEINIQEPQRIDYDGQNLSKEDFVKHKSLSEFAYFILMHPISE